MRLSIEDYYSGDADGAELFVHGVIRLNGEIVSNVVLADDEEGYIEHYLVDENGIIVVDDLGHTVIETSFGEVKICDSRKEMK